MHLFLAFTQHLAEVSAQVESVQRLTVFVVIARDGANSGLHPSCSA